MSPSSDIETLFGHFGGNASDYQEIGRENEASSARTRWPLLVTLDLTQPSIPAIPQRGDPLAQPGDEAAQAQSPEGDAQAANGPAEAGHAAKPQVRSKTPLRRAASGQGRTRCERGGGSSACCEYYATHACPDCIASSRRYRNGAAHRQCAARIRSGDGACCHAADGCTHNFRCARFPCTRAFRARFRRTCCACVCRKTHRARECVHPTGIGRFRGTRFGTCCTDCTCRTWHSAAIHSRQAVQAGRAQHITRGTNTCC
jgi:hypothetical protein